MGFLYISNYDGFTFCYLGCKIMRIGKAKKQNSMTNLQKLGRLYAFFASCDYGHNNNILNITASDNCILIEIGFDTYNYTELKVDFDFTLENNDFIIAWKRKYVLSAIVWDFDKLDELLDIIFSKVIITNMNHLSLKRK